MSSLFHYNEFSPDDLAYPDLVEIYGYWQSRRQGRFAPSWADINLMDLSAKLIPRICVVDVHADKPDFTYRFWGTAITRMHQYDLTGKSVLELKPDSFGKTVHQHYKTVFDAKEPRGFQRKSPQRSGFWPTIPRKSR